MGTCFVIQPFDNGKYDKRYRGVFKLAIEAAGLDAYRVDQDTSVEVPIQSIEDGIRASTACLAEISEDNANVWYELGYAMALGKPVVMVCSSDRTKFPFDIQHRHVIAYRSEGPADFDELRAAITARLKARLASNAMLDQVAEAQLMSEVRGVSNPEVMLIASIISESARPGAAADLWSVKNAADRQGLTAVAYQLGLRRLSQRGFTEDAFISHQDGESEGVVLSDAAWNWIDQNESLFRLEKSKPSAKRSTKSFEDDFEDDNIPF
jgi:hypothetical protein